MRRGALAGLTFRLTNLYQRLPNQPQIPTRGLDDDSDASDGSEESEDYGDDDCDATDDEE